MSSKSLPLRELLGASAAARDYPFLDRAALWEERLAMHLKDIESLGSAPQTGDMLPLPDRIPVELEASEARQAAPPASGEGEGADFAFTDAAEIVRLVQTKQVSPLEVADAFLARIERQRDLNAFITVEPDRVRDEARNLTERLARGDRLGPLAGVPVAVKDLMYVKGHPLTCGTKAMPGDIADSDAQVVANLRAAGAVILGTTNLHELAYGVTSANVHFGPVVNPVAPGHLPGGSSGGSGASVAGGLATIAVGTDTGGSIRIPAACCGVVGFKPTYEAVSREGVWPLAWTLDHIGPLARSVEDAATAFEVMAALPAGSMSVLRIERPRLIKPQPFFYDHLEASVRERIELMLGRLAGEGASMEERYVEGIEYVPAAQWITIASEGCQANWELLTSSRDGIAADVRVRLEVGQFIGAIDYIKAQRLRRWLRDNMVTALDDADVFVIPTLPVSIPKQGVTTIEIGGRVLPLPTAVTRLTSPFNSSGMPAISIPCGHDALGLPFGLQLIGRPGADATVLAVARWCEAILGEA